MARRKNEIIFEAKIDYSGPGTLRIGDRENQDVEARVISALSNELPHELETLFDLKIDVQIMGTRDGSIIVFFGAVILGVSALSRYKNLYDSIVLIEDQARRVIRATLRCSEKYNVNVNSVIPSQRSLEALIFRWRRRDRPFSDDFSGYSFEADDWRVNNRRDGFFWFLLILCILESVALGMLLHIAVLKTYFR